MKIDKKYIDNMIAHCKKICNVREVDHIINSTIGYDLYFRLSNIYLKACEKDSEKSTREILKKWEVPIEDDELREQMEQVEDKFDSFIQSELIQEVYPG
jgi:hypothetical protein